MKTLIPIVENHLLNCRNLKDFGQCKLEQKQNFLHGLGLFGKKVQSSHHQSFAL